MVTKSELPVSEYAPGADPLKMTGVTAKAVNLIGEATARELNLAADSLEADAKEIADRIRKFAGAVVEHAVTASEAVAKFSTKAADVLETIRGLEVRLHTDQSTTKVEPIDDGKPIPKFLGNGPAVGGNGALAD